VRPTTSKLQPPPPAEPSEDSRLPPASPWKIPNACGPRWLSPDLCFIRLWAPHGEDVTLEFENGEPVPMVRDGDFWHATATCKPGDRYRVAMGSSWNDCFAAEGARLIRRDPCARECDFDSDWCVLQPLPVQRPIRSVPLPMFNELIIYEMHLGTWVSREKEADAKVFAAAMEALDYVADLGYNCVQLMPVIEFGGLWGYNPRQLMAAHGPWGTAEELRRLVARAHELGIAVLFDVVLNHGSSKRNALWNYDGFGKDGCGGIYFEGEKDTPWGRRFAFHKPEVKDYLKECCRVWVEEYHCDGLRMDSVHNMPWWLLKELTHELKECFPELMLIAEITPETPAIVNNAGFHSCWVHATHFDSLKIMKRFDGGDDKICRLSMLKGMATLHGGRFSTVGGVQSILGSHDQIGDRRDGHQDGRGTHRYYVSRLGGRANWHARAQSRAWFCFQNCMKGLPMTFMGTETLQDGTFCFPFGYVRFFLSLNPATAGFGLSFLTGHLSLQSTDLCYRDCGRARN
jgi:1,4-alpha-glucan branching enzyme